jgi:hypothetical protein
MSGPEFEILNGGEEIVMVATGARFPIGIEEPYHEFMLLVER